jgi:uncharacterized protein DUF5667
MATMLVTSLLAGVAFATEDALPDSPLHDVKIATEHARLALARSSETLIAVELDIAEARLDEAVALQSQNREAEAEAAVSAYGEHLASAAAHLEETTLGPLPERVEQFRVVVVQQLQKSARVPEPSGSGAPSNTALSIASEIAATIRRDGHAGGSEIATAAASAAAKAATNAEQRAPATPAAEVAASSGEARVVPPPTARSTTQPPAPARAPMAPSAAVGPRSSPLGQTTSPGASAQSGQNDKQRIDTAVKSAREAADRAQQSADRAKQAADKSKKDKNNGQDSRSSK